VIAIVRDVPSSFADAIAMDPKPIDVDLARAQHRAYVDALRPLVDRVIELPTDEAHPDSCFVEDTAVVIGRRAALTRMGAISRRGEEHAMRDALVDLGVEVVAIEAPGTLDGGDVLFTGREIFVGLSTRTNEEGARQLAAIFPQFPIRTIRVSGALHLKSIATALDADTLLVSRDLPLTGYELLRVADANVVVIGDTVIAQPAFPSEKAGKKRVITVSMSELAKADAALTCCSVLV
jgi:dimethylargininase